MKKEFKLASLNVIAYLKTMDLQPLRVKYEDKQVSHYFEDTDELHFYLKEYKRNTELQKFITALSQTRTTVKELAKRK
ncbi:DUF5659 domain-containing protein [Bacillus infantis]|uniref:DUF5659 domain-containing protein n=1 Tax=Bacillus infantis TaxID=324767 RepID=UPI00209CA334|nr:DUF5659 domain-containing protein [Bacillus infantis]MCP1159472.1 DUF5659 domain-containing protein [Bacillus infantis]